MGNGSLDKTGKVISLATLLWGCGHFSVSFSHDDRSVTSSSSSDDSAQKPQEADCPSPNATNCTVAKPTPTPSPTVVTLPAKCKAPEGVSNAFTTPQGLVGLINALPKPLSLACFLETLPETHRIAATSSGSSVQPAHSSKDPRVFVETGDMLLGIVPDGPDRNALEFSMLLGSTESVKGEIVFPVTTNLDPLSPFTRIKNGNRPGTTCGICHVNETDASAQFGAGSYNSRALRPIASTVLSFFQIQALARACETDASERCRIWRAIMIPNKTALYTFPTEMPVLGSP